MPPTPSAKRLRSHATDRESTMLIINADDFGLSHSVNLAVIRAFERGLCTSCSVMPNMRGFEEACDLARKHELTDRAGLHLTLTQGGTDTRAPKAFPRFQALR